MRATLAVCAFALWCAAPARAYVCGTVLEGPSFHWDERDITVHRSGGSDTVTDSDIEQALTRAAASWSDVDCSDVVIDVGATTDTRTIGFDWMAGHESKLNENIVIFRSGDDGDPIDKWVHQGGALALTTVTFVRSSGQLLDADIEMNEEFYTFTACEPADCAVVYDVQNVLTHELGHVLGLDHPPDQPDATMYAVSPEGDLAKRDLSPDDTEGVCFLYPDGVRDPGACNDVPREPGPDITIAPAVCGTVGDSAAVGPLVVVLWFIGQPRTRLRRGDKVA